MEIGVLGPLQVRHHGARLQLGAPQQQQVLALLALNVSKPVSIDEIAFELWGERPPASAVAKVRAHAAMLRRLFAAEVPDVCRVIRAGSGYLLEVERSLVDMVQFQDERNRGLTLVARQPVAAVQHLERALSLWQGVMLDGLPRGPVLTSQCAIVEQGRLATVDSLAELHLSLGHPARAGTLLQRQVLAEPLRERSYVLLMRAHYQSDGIAAALKTYETIRSALADELGLEPGSELQRLHRAILNRDSTLDTADSTPAM